MKKKSTLSYAALKLKFLLFAFLSLTITAAFAQTTDFVMTIDGSSRNFTVPTNSSYIYKYNVNWGDGQTSTNLTGSSTHYYLTAGTYTIRISGTFPAIHFGNGGEARKLLTVSQWGSSMNWKSFKNGFYGCTSLDVTATDLPNLTSASSMSKMFQGCTKLVGTSSFGSWNTAAVTDMSDMFYQSNLFNQDIGSWNTAAVTDMSGMFGITYIFNQDIGSWNTASVTNMSKMFYLANFFNQDIGSWNTAAVTDMSSMFYNAPKFNHDIGLWNTASVTDMHDMFNGAETFQQDLNAWNTSAVTSMKNTFKDAVVFNHDIGTWNTTSVTDMSYMLFRAHAFNQDISAWKTGSVTNMAGMFQAARTFNYDIGSWNTAAVKDMSSMFNSASAFNQDISSWETTGVSNMSSMFKSALAFNQDIGSWNTAAVTNMSYMFSGARGFDQDIGSWSTAAVTNMLSMFNDARIFNQNIGSWNTAAVKDMSMMFNGAKIFNQDISSWNTAAVIDMKSMFNGAEKFDQDIGSWSTAGVKDMSYMFTGAIAFNKELSRWNTAAVTNMNYIFYNAKAFNQSLADWEINAVTDMRYFLDYCKMSTINYDATLIGWASSGQNPVAKTFGATGLKYCNGETARAILKSVADLTPQGDVLNCTGVLPLPLKLISFTCINEENYNLLQWKTESEVNTKTFILEKSKDGSSFASFATINALVNSTNSYSYKDDATDGSTYYRLKMVDVDGNFSYSSIIRVSNEIKEKASVYPNPVTSTFTLSVDETFLNTDALLLDAKGMVVQKIKITNQQQQVNASSLPAGIFLLQFNNGSTIKILKN